MKLTDFLSNKTQIDDSGRTQVQSAQNNSLVNRQIHSFAPGQTLQGELIAKNGNEVQIRLAEDMIIRARVEQNMNLEVGKMMTFEVKNNGQTLTLSPLFANMATDANVLKALDMASLPINSDTISMTEQLMQAGLSIDKNSLQQVFRETNLYSQSNISDIVELHKLALPVNEENLSQVASYKNLTHQLVKGLNEVLDLVPGTIQEMVGSGNAEGAAKVYQELFQMISGAESENVEQGTVLEANKSSEGPIQQNAADTLEKQVIVDNSLHNNEVPDKQPNTADTLLKLLSEMDENTVTKQAGDTIQGSPEALAKELITMLKASAEPQVYGELNSKLQQLVQGNTNNITESQLAALVNKLLQQGLANKDSSLLQGMVESKEVAAFVKNNLAQLWSITPEEVAEPGKVEELYQRLNKQLKGLAQTLEATNQTSTEIYKATTNLNQNVDFLQQLNQTYTYIQLPLRLQQGNQAHGDLYVYTNKKHLAASDGKVTALLHLDMEHLGPVDVYVAMQSEKVSTKFYVQDDEMLDFLAEHMDILTERLKKRGYDISCEMKLRDKMQEENTGGGVIQKLLEKEKHIPLVQYAFDVRT